MAIRVWKKATKLGVRGEEEDNVYVNEIKGIEKRDKKGRRLKEEKPKGAQWIYFLITIRGVATLSRGSAFNKRSLKEWWICVCSKKLRCKVWRNRMWS